MHLLQSLEFWLSFLNVFYSIVFFIPIVLSNAPAIAPVIEISARLFAVTKPVALSPSSYETRAGSSLLTLVVTSRVVRFTESVYLSFCALLLSYTYGTNLFVNLLYFLYFFSIYTRRMPNVLA